MSTVANIVVAIIGLLHVYILVLQMFWWDKPKGMKAFNLTPEFAAASKVLAANQGLYNGFLAAGLFWGLSLGAAGNDVKVFFLLCVLVAGVYGAATANKRILFNQAVPAMVGLVLPFLAPAGVSAAEWRGMSETAEDPRPDQANRPMTDPNPSSHCVDLERAQSLYQAGRARMDSGAFEEAIQAFSASVAIDPHFKALELMGECLLALGRPIQAVVPLAAASALNDQVRAPSLLAQAFLSIGDYQQAARLAKAVLVRASGNRVAQAVAANPFVQRAIADDDAV